MGRQIEMINMDIDGLIQQLSEKRGDETIAEELLAARYTLFHTKYVPKLNKVNKNFDNFLLPVIIFRTFENLTFLTASSVNVYLAFTNR